MSYQRADGRFVYTETFKLPSTVITASGNSTGVDVGPAGVLRSLNLTASAVGGTTPSCTVTVQTSPDNSTWTPMASSYTAITANGSQSKSWTPLDRYVRLAWVVTGTTPTITLVGTGDLV